MNNPDHQFINGLNNYLSYWNQTVDLLVATSQYRIKIDQKNLKKAITYGLCIKETRTQAVTLLCKTYQLIEMQADWQNWIDTYEFAITYPPVYKPEEQIQLLILLGKLFRNIYEKDKAINIHHQALKIAHFLDDSELRGKSYLQLSESYRVAQKYEDAENYGFEAVNILQAHNNNEFLCHTYVTLSLISAERGKFTRAEEQLNTAFELGFNNLSNPLKARLLNIKANIMLNQSRYEEAESNYRSALSLLETSHSEIDLFHVKNSLAVLYYKMGLFEEAESIYRNLELMIRHQPDKLFYHSLVLSSLGNILLNQSRLEEARLIIEESISQWKKVGNEVHLANSTGILAEIYVQQGNIAEAKSLFQKSSKLLKKHPENNWAQELHLDFQQQYNNLTGSIKAKHVASP